MRITMVQPYITSDFRQTQECYNVISFGLASELAKRGYDITILTTNLLRPEITGTRWQFQRFEDSVNGFKVIYIPTLIDTGNFPIFPTLQEELAKSTPDLVQAAEDMQPASLVSGLWCRRRGIPFIVYQGMYTIDHSHRFLRRAYQSTACKAVYRLCQAIICQSTAAADFVISEGAERHKARFVPIGFHRGHFERTDSHLLARFTGGPRKDTLVSVGRLVRIKGFHFAIKAMRNIADEFPEVAYVIFGSGAEERRLRDMVEAHGLQRNVFIVTDSIPNRQMNEIFSSARANLIPSTFEIFNMTMLESLGCGCPVIASRVGGMADVVRPGLTGYLAEPGDINALARYALRLLRDEQGWLRLSQAAQDDMLNYDWERIAASFADLYTEFHRVTADRSARDR